MMNIDKVIIRRPHKDELVNIEGFFKLILVDTFEQNKITHLSELLEEEIGDKKEFILNDLNSDGKIRYFLLAEYGGEIIGSIASGPASTLISKLTQNKIIDMLEMGSVYVHPSYQRKGIVNLLINSLLLKFKEDKIERFCFDSGYPIAQQVWSKKMGEPKYVITDCWGENQPHMIWEIGVDEALGKIKLQ